MKIKLDDKYTLSADARQYILQETGTVQDGKNKGEESIKTVGFHNTMENALKQYKELSIRLSGATTLFEVLELIKKIDKNIEEILNGN